MNEPRLLDVFTGRLRLEGTLTTRTGLHIGAGGSRDPLATDSPVVRNAAGQPFIPGASLKGVLRSAAEALLRHAPLPLPSGGKLWTCEIFGDDDDKCISHRRLKEIRQAVTKKQGSPHEVARTVWQESCTICRLFGSLALATDFGVVVASPLLIHRPGIRKIGRPLARSCWDCPRSTNPSSARRPPRSA